jgi:hypothetical protein
VIPIDTKNLLLVIQIINNRIKVIFSNDVAFAHAALEII